MLTLSGPNTFAGGTTMNAGTLVLANGTSGSALGTGNLTLNGGTLAAGWPAASIAAAWSRPATPPIPSPRGPACPPVSTAP